MVPVQNGPVPWPFDTEWISRLHNMTPAHRVIVLSFFDGVGTAFIALENLCGPPALAMAWEIDPECIEVTQTRFPYIVHRGDINQDSPTAVSEMIRKHDPHQTCVILLLAAPPCPDFSSITGNGQGFEGTEGCKFKAFVKFSQQLEAQLDGWECHHLIENVVMQQKAEIQWVSDNTHCSPVVADAADFGWVSRPRLWWSKIDWATIETNPVTQQPFRWGTINKLPRLHLDVPFQHLSEVDLAGLALHPRVQNHEIRLPCMTTPAPDENGRPAPKRVRGRINSDTRQRWLDGRRQWAPWHYAQEAMLTCEDGTLVLPPITLKECLHQIPPGHTQVGSVSERARHRMLGNSWHVGVAQILLCIILTSCNVGQASATTPKVDYSPKLTALQFVLSMAKSEHHAMGPTPRSCSTLSRAPAGDQWDHWDISMKLVHPLLETPVLEAGSQQVMDKWKRLGDLPRLRNEVNDEVEMMVQDWQEHTSQWIKNLKPHIRAVYESEGNRPTQIPVFLDLLQDCGYPAMPHITEDLNLGFDYVGPQHPGPGWLPRLDEAYAHPIQMQTFADLNKQYIFQKLKRKFVDPHWAPMLEELLQEKDLGRVQGPFAAPADWPCRTVAPHGQQLLPTPNGEIFPSVCFAVVQSDKIRRCEDLRRSFHNQTIYATQTPTHHNVDTYIEVIRSLGQSQRQPVLWSHDLDSAYRQFPVKDQRYSYTILFTESGPTLWRHGALAFGATSSVWSFNRAADCLMFLARKLHIANAFHYVDDYAGIEGSNIADSSFEAFSKLCTSLGLRTKPKKAAPPARRQPMLGVVFQIHDDGVLLSPCPDRVGKILEKVQSHIQSDSLTSAEAQKLAGKLVFLQTTVFGQVGKAALTPIYSRASSWHTNDEKADCLNTGLRRALRVIHRLLQDLQPRWVPFSSDAPQTVIYTDAFFELGSRRFKPGDRDIPTQWSPRQTSQMKNGWGMVCKTSSGTHYAFGRVPLQLLQEYCHRKAFIYFLEAIAPLLTLIIMGSQMDKFVLLFIDNQPALSALQRGYGGDETINNAISLFWGLANKLKLFIHFSWVPSSHNVSDKVSRHDLSEAVSQGWQQVNTNLSTVYEVLQRASHDSNFAMFEAVDRLLEFQYTASPSCKVAK